MFGRNQRQNLSLMRQLAGIGLEMAWRVSSRRAVALGIAVEALISTSPAHVPVVRYATSTSHLVVLGR
jgi:hypothetical protein